MLTGWKSIAKYLNITVQTAKKWHKVHGLPVIRGPYNVPITFEDLVKEWLLEYDRIKKKKHS